jgi:hypothetical protein
VDNWNNITNSQNRVRKKSFGGTFCFSNCHIIRLDTGGLVFLANDMILYQLNKTENHFSPYPRLRKKLAINCGRTACQPTSNTLHLLNSEAINYGAIGIHKNN